MLIGLAACWCSVGQMELLFVLRSLLQSARNKFSAALSLYVKLE